jgi:hypothetical protein
LLNIQSIEPIIDSFKNTELINNTDFKTLKFSFSSKNKSKTQVNLKINRTGVGKKYRLYITNNQDISHRKELISNNLDLLLNHVVKSFKENYEFSKTADS